MKKALFLLFLSPILFSSRIHGQYTPKGDSLSVKAISSAYVPTELNNPLISKINKLWLKGGVLEGKKPQDEILGLRTDISKKFQLGNGKVQVIIGGPFHFLNKRSEWQDINLNIKTRLDPQFKYYNEENRFTSRFGSKHENGVEIAYKNNLLQFGINTTISSGAWHPSVTLTNQNILTKENFIVYKNIYDSVDLEYELNTEGILHKIKFNNKSCFSGISESEDYLKIEEEIQLPANAILVDSSGIISADRVTHGFIYVVVEDDTVFTILPSRIWDASYTGEILSSDINTEGLKIIESFVSILKGNKIIYSSKIPANWLLSANRIYPIIFDPNIFVDNNSSTGSALGYPYPFNTCRYQRVSQIVFPRIDIGMAGSITDVYFYQIASNPLSTYNTSIGMKTVSYGSMASPTLETGITNCYTYNPGFQYNATQQWWLFTLTNPFYYSYSSTANLLVETKFNNCGYSVTGSCSSSCPPVSTGGRWGGFYASYNAHRWAYSNSSSCSSSPPTGSLCPVTEGNPAFGNAVPFIAITITPGSSPGCSGWYTSPPSASFSSGANSGTFNVYTTVGGCSFTATSNNSWITGIYSAGGGAIGYSVSANTGGARNGSISIRDASNVLQYTFNISQTAGSSPVCSTCPTYNYSITPSTSWQYHSSSITTGSCKKYYVYMTAGITYTFSTCTTDGGSASNGFDVYFKLYNSGCSNILNNDNFCGPNSYLTYIPSTSGVYYFEVNSCCTGSSGGSYTLAYKNTAPCSLPNITASSNSPVTIGSTLNLSVTTVSGATYSWTGPNGYTSNIQNPPRYNATTSMAGSYCVIATVGSCTTNQSCTPVTIISIPPVANFTANKNNIVCGDAVQFSDASSNAVSWLWTFSGGDGDQYSSRTSTSPNPNITFYYSGSYSVILRATNPAGNNSITKYGYITVTPLLCIARKPLGSFAIQENYSQKILLEPIQIGTRTYKYKHTDFRISVVGGDAAFTRYYNSFNNQQNGPCGFGWTHSFYFVVQNLFDTAWDVHYPDGHSSRFIPLYNGGGVSFPLYAGTTDSLIRNSANEYWLYTKEKKIYKFSTTGNLNQIVDPNGNQTTLTYSSGNLTQIQFPGGRTLVFGYTGSRISSVQVPSGRICRYGYNSSGDQDYALSANGDTTRFTYTNHLMQTFVNPLGNTIISNSYSQNKIIAQADAYNISSTITYDYPSIGDATVRLPDSTTRVFHHDSAYRLTRAKDALDKISTYAYDDNTNHVDTTINEKNQRSLFLYDWYGNITSQTFPGNQTYLFNYNQYSKPTQIRNPRGYTTYFSYNNSNGNLLNIHLPDNSWNYFNYYSNGTTRFYVNGNSDTLYYFYNASGDLIKIGTPTGNIFYGYDIDGRLDTIIDENRNRTLLFHDNNDNIIQIKDALNQSMYFAYDKDNQLTGFTDKKGYTTTYSYDKKGRLIARINALQYVDSFYYDVMDCLIRWRDALGHNTFYSYDENGRRKAVTKAIGQVQYESDEIGNLTKVIDQNNNPLNIAYNSANQVSSITDALNNQITMMFDSMNNITRFTNNRLKSTNYRYDPRNLLNQVTDVNNIITSYQNDFNGNMTSLTDGNSHSQNFIIGKLNQVNSFTDASGRTFNLNHDSVGNIRTVTKPVGTINHQYDSLNRLTKVTLSSGDVYLYTYDPNNNVKTATNNTGTSFFFYDALNRLTPYVDPFNKQILYGYNAVGSITSIEYPESGHVVLYTYDTINRLKTVKDWNNNIFTYIYDATGKLAKQLYPNGIHCDYSYDAANRLISKMTYKSDSTIIFGQQFLFNNVDTPKERRWGSVPSNFTPSRFRYGYQNNDALINDSIKSYISDNNGNRIREVHGSDTTRYNWTTDQLLTSLSKAGAATTFIYDAFGHRLQRTKGTDQTKYVQSLNGPISLPLQTTDANGNVRANYIYGLGLLEQIDSLGNELFYHFDSRHNTIAITDQNDSVRATYTYTLSGLITEKTGNLIQPFTFLGEFGVEQETDSCYYIRARYYDASTSTFLTKDPLLGDGFDPLSLNRYAYALHDPLTSYDITGLSQGKDDDEGFWEKSGRIFMESVNESIRRAQKSFTDPMTYQIAFGVAMLATDGLGQVNSLKNLTNAELIARAALGAERAIGGTGNLAGIAKHEYASNFLKTFQEVYGYRGIETKVYFNNNASLGLGNRGFLDVWDKTSNIIYDFKFGGATMSKAQYSKYFRNFGFPIEIIKP